MNIEHLISGLKKKDENAFKELVYTFSRRLMTIAKIYSTDEEESRDVLQDAFIVVFQKIDGFSGDNEAMLYGWIKRIIINICMSKNQKMYKRMEDSLDNMIINKGIESMAESHLSHEEIMKLIFSLPDGYRQIFALYAIEGYSHKEIATKLNIGENNSRTKYMRSRNMLKDKIELNKKVAIS